MANYKISRTVIIFSSFAAFAALTVLFLFNPADTALISGNGAKVISKINLLAAPIVPCGLKPGPGIPTSYTKPCTICHLYILSGNLINFVIYNIAIPLASLMFLVAGVYLIFSGGSEERMKTGRAIFQNTVIALLIVFCSWIFLNTLFQYLVNPKEFGWLETSWWKPFGNCP